MLGARVSRARGGWHDRAGASKTSHEFFDVTIDAGVAHLRLARPDHLNSMARGFWSELPAIVRDIDENARARVIVISSTGKHFSAGMDLSVFAENGALAEPARIRTSPTKRSATWYCGCRRRSPASTRRASP